MKTLAIILSFGYASNAEYNNNYEMNYQSTHNYEQQSSGQYSGNVQGYGIQGYENGGNNQQMYGKSNNVGNMNKKNGKDGQYQQGYENYGRNGQAQYGKKGSKMHYNENSAGNMHMNNGNMNNGKGQYQLSNGNYRGNGQAKYFKKGSKSNNYNGNFVMYAQASDGNKMKQNMNNNKPANRYAKNYHNGGYAQTNSGNYKKQKKQNWNGGNQMQWQKKSQCCMQTQNSCDSPEMVYVQENMPCPRGYQENGEFAMMSASDGQCSQATTNTPNFNSSPSTESATPNTSQPDSAPSQSGEDSQPAEQSPISNVTADPSTLSSQESDASVAYAAGLCTTLLIVFNMLFQ